MGVVLSTTSFVRQKVQHFVGFDMCGSVRGHSRVQHAQLFTLVSRVLSALDGLFTSYYFPQRVRCMVRQAFRTVYPEPSGGALE